MKVVVKFYQKMFSWRQKLSSDGPLVGQRFAAGLEGC